MEPAELLEAYFATGRNRAVLADALRQAPTDFVTALQRRAVQRYAAGTLTLTELKLLAHDLATLDSTPEGQQLYLAVADTNACCVRTANVEARQRLQAWLQD